MVQQVAYIQKDGEERINTITIFSGMPGVGKSHQLRQVVKVLAKGDPEKGKLPQAVLIYDVNDEYPEFMPISWNDIKKQQPGTIRRLLAFKMENGQRVAFSTDELTEGFEKIIKDCGNQVVVLEDFNAYSIDTRRVSVTGTINRARHKGVDLIIMLQEIAPVTRQMWATCGFYYYFTQLSDIESAKNNIKKGYVLAWIADSIVREQYEEAEYQMDQGNITKNECKEFQSLYIQIDYFKNKLFGCPQEAAFRRAVEKYLKAGDRHRKIKAYCFNNDLDFKKIENRQRAVNYLYEREFRRYWGVS